MSSELRSISPNPVPAPSILFPERSLCLAPDTIRKLTQITAENMVTKAGSFSQMEKLNAHLLKSGSCLTEALAQLAEHKDDRPMMNLAETENCSIWLLGWRVSKDATDIHDHGESKAFVNIVKSCVAETIYVPLNDGYVKGISRQLHEGLGIRIPSPYIHIFDSKCKDTFSVSLHTYSPSLSLMNLFEVQDTPDGIKLPKTGTWKR